MVLRAISLVLFLFPLLGVPGYGDQIKEDPSTNMEALLEGALILQPTDLGINEVRILMSIGGENVWLVAAVRR